MNGAFPGPERRSLPGPGRSTEPGSGRPPYAFGICLVHHRIGYCRIPYGPSLAVQQS